MSTLPSLVLFLAGFLIYRTARVAIFGRDILKFVLVLSLVMFASRADAVPPAGQPEKMRLTWSGFSVTVHDVEDVEIDLDVIPKSGQWEMVWNGSTYSTTITTPDEGAPDYPTTLTISLGLEDFKWVARIQYSDTNDVGIEGELGLEFATAANATPAGPYTMVSAHVSKESEFALYETYNGDEAEGESWGTVGVVSSVEPHGTQFTEGVVPFRIVWAIGDTLWRGSNDQRVAPLAPLAAKIHFPIAPTWVAGDMTTPVASNGWDATDTAWCRENLLAAASLISNVQPAGYNSGFHGTHFWGDPQRWEVAAIFAPSFGGYAAAALDVVDVTYPERAAHGHYNTPSGGSTIDANVSVTWVGVNAETPAPVERWVIVFATESDTRKPYCEIRKANGVRTRLFAAGHIIRGGSAGSSGSIGSTCFRYAEDGRTVSPFITDNFEPVAASGANNVSTYPGIWIEAQTIGNAGTIVPVTFPAEGLPEDWTGVDGSGPQGLNKLFTGVGGATTQPIIGQIAERATATSQPSFMRGELSSWAAVTNAGDAMDAMGDVFNSFGILSLINSESITVGGTTGVSFTSFGEILSMVMVWPTKVATDFGGLFTIVRWYTGILMILATGMYTVRMVAWAFAMRDSAGMVAPLKLEE